MSEMILHGQPAVESQTATSSNVVYTPRFDICETDEEFTLYGEMPGVAPEDVEIRYENQQLAIWGKVAPRHSEARYWAQEYGVGNYYRTFALGDAVDAGSIQAEVKDGILTVHLPKKAEARPVKIAVKPG